MNTAIALAGIAATLTMIGFLVAGIRKGFSVDANSATLHRVRRYARCAFAAALVAVALELFDFDSWSIFDVVSAATAGVNARYANRRLVLRREREAVMAREAAVKFDLPWVGGDPR